MPNNQAKDDKQTLADLTAAIRTGQDFYEAYFNRAWLGSVTQRYEPALADASECVRIDPDEAGAFRLRGEICNRERNYPQAMTDFNHAIQLDGKNPAAYQDRGEVLASLGEYDQAMADYDKAASLGLNTAFFHRRRAVAFEHVGDNSKALEEYSTAIKLAPPNRRSPSAIGVIWSLCKKDCLAAIADFDHAIAPKPTAADVYNNRGNCLWAKGNQNAARADFQKALSLENARLQNDPKDGYALNGLAWILATSPDQRSATAPKPSPTQLDSASQATGRTKTIWTLSLPHTRKLGNSISPYHGSRRRLEPHRIRTCWGALSSTSTVNRFARISRSRIQSAVADFTITPAKPVACWPSANVTVSVTT
jgi:tetratricopeptide (TPR) repeat protein